MKKINTNGFLYSTWVFIALFLFWNTDVLGQNGKRYFIDPVTPKGLRTIFQFNNDKAPFLSAHRGGPEMHLPENHTATFANTLKHTWAIMEIDPRYTKDSVIIVHHDNTLDRTTTGTGRVSDYTYSEIMKLHLKDMKGNPTRYKVQTLDEMIRWAKGKTILVLDRKDVPVEERVKAVQENNAEAFVIVMAYSYEEAKKVYSMNQDIMMQVFIGKPDKVEEFEKTGVPWENVVAFVSHQMPDDTSVFQKVNEKGAYCILGTSRNLDREWIRGNVTDISDLHDEYASYLAKGVGILETDIPVEVSKVFTVGKIHRSKAKYFKKK